MGIFYSGLYEMPKKQLLVSPPFKPLVKYFALLMYLNIRFVSFWEFPKIKDLKLFMQENYKFIAHNSFSIVFGISGNYFLKLKQRNQVFFLAHTKHCQIHHLPQNQVHHLPQNHKGALLSGQRPAARVRLLAMRRGELSAVIARLMPNCP